MTHFIEFSLLLDIPNLDFVSKSILNLNLNLVSVDKFLCKVSFQGAVIQVMELVHLSKKDSRLKKRCFIFSYKFTQYHHTFIQ